MAKPILEDNNVDFKSMEEFNMEEAEVQMKLFLKTWKIISCIILCFIIYMFFLKLKYCISID